MKLTNRLIIPLLTLSLLLQLAPPVKAGGAGVQVYETNVGDKHLAAGIPDQLLMSFTVKPTPLIPVDYSIDSLDITCSPSHGLTELKLMQGDTEISSGTFEPTNTVGNQSAHLGASQFIIPNEGETEFKLLVTIEEGTGDFMTACAIDDLFLRNLETQESHSGEAQAEYFSGLDRLVYIDDLNTEDTSPDVTIIDSHIRPSGLGLDTKHNLLTDLVVRASEDTKLKDLFIFCDHGDIFQEYRLEIDGVLHTYSAMQNDGYTNGRPELSTNDRVVFPELNTSIRSGESVNLKLFGDTYNYFHYYPDVETACSVIDVRTHTFNASLERLQTVTELESSLSVNPDPELAKKLRGRVLLQVETAGQAWYLEPLSEKKYYLPDGIIAYQALRSFGLGVTNADLSKIPVGIEERFNDTDSDGDGLADKLEEGLKTNPYEADSDGDGATDGDEIAAGSNPLDSGTLRFDSSLANRLKGRILLQTESRGEAWYVNPANGKRYYMKDGEAAYQIMRFLSLGITDTNIRMIEVGSMEFN